MNSMQVEDEKNLDDKPVFDVLAGLFKYQTLMLANELNLFSSLNDGPKSLEEISKKLNIASRSTEALLLMLVNMNFISLSDQKYSLTDHAKKYLLKDSPTYFGGLLDIFALNTLESLRQSVLSNEPKVYGDEAIFDSHEKQFDIARNFTQAMHSSSIAPASAWPEFFDFSNHKVFLDIGGGSGAHIIGVLNRWTHLKGINFDIPPVCEVSQEYFNQYDLSDRAKVVQGDFWNDDFPKADVHFYSQIFHDWPKDKCQFFSEKSFKSLPVKGKVLIHEMLFDDDKSGPAIAAAANVAMLNWTEGKQYSGKELSKFLKDAGFVNVKSTKTFGYWGVVSGEKP